MGEKTWASKSRGNGIIPNDSKRYTTFKTRKEASQHHANCEVGKCLVFYSPSITLHYCTSYTHLRAPKISFCWTDIFFGINKRITLFTPKSNNLLSYPHRVFNFTGELGRGRGFKPGKEIINARIPGSNLDSEPEVFQDSPITSKGQLHLFFLRLHNPHPYFSQ